MDKDRLTIIYRLVSNGSISCEEFIKLMENEVNESEKTIIIPINEPYTLPGKNYPHYEPIQPWYTTTTCSSDSCITSCSDDSYTTYSDDRYITYTLI